MELNNIYINRVFKKLLGDKKLFIVISIIVFFWIIIYLVAFYEPKYTSRATVILVDTSTPTYVTNLEGESGFANNSKEAITQLEILDSFQLSNFLMNYIKEKYPNDLNKNINEQKFYNKLQKRLKGKTKLATDIINISFSWNDPKKAQILLKQILKEYKNINLTINKEIQTNRRQYIDETLAKVEVRLEKVRVDIANYMKSNLAISIDEESRRLVNQNVNFETRLKMTNASIQRYRSTIKDIENKLGLNTKDAIQAVALGADNKNLAQLRAQLDENLQQLAFDSIKMAPTNPKIVARNKSIEEIKKQIQEQIMLSIGKEMKEGSVNIYDPVRTKLVLDLVDAQTEHASLVAEKHSLEQSIKEIDKTQAAIPNKKYTLENLEQQEKNLSIAFDELKKKQIEAHIKEAEISSNIVIIDPPDFPESQSFPTILHIVLMGLAFSFLLTIVVSILKTLIENVCEGVNEIESTTGKKIIGVLPWYDETQKEEEIEKIDEIAYESILSNILIKNYSANAKVLTFSSNSIKKYNSKVVYKLATKLNKLGHSVVVIDSDLRNPTLYRDSNIEDTYKTQLSDLILDIGLKLRQNQKINIKYIQENLSKDSNGLSLLSNVKPVNNSYDYFAGNTFELIIDTLKENFDWILIDTPTVTLAPEVFVIAKRSDSFILITTIKVTYSLLKRIVNDLREANINFIGCIIRDKNVNVSEYLEFLK
ncbi:MAG: hypothetical protein AB1782_13225 [Cyanobacteriota bacterium]